MDARYGLRPENPASMNLEKGKEVVQDGAEHCTHFLP
jgi:hypothetical protein